MANIDLDLELDQLRKRIESLENKWPNTMLLSQRFIDRAIAVFFLSVIGNLLVGLVVGILWLILGLLGLAINSK